MTETNFFQVTVPPTPTVEVQYVGGQVQVPGPQGPPGPPGPQGPPGTSGSTTAGTTWWYGNGFPPVFITGMKAGDMYMDTSTGNIYELS